MTTEEFLKKIKERGVSVEEAPNLIKKAKQVGLPSEIITEKKRETNSRTNKIIRFSRRNNYVSNSKRIAT